jgi:hypothetical protein
LDRRDVSRGASVKTARRHKTYGWRIKYGLIEIASIRGPQAFDSIDVTEHMRMNRRR